MKRVILSEETIDAVSRRAALSELARRLREQGRDAEVNKDHNCVDVFDENDVLIEQQYVEETNERNSGKRNRYNYVGPGNGDYVKVVHDVSERDFTPDDPYIKQIASTNRQKARKSNHRNNE